MKKMGGLSALKGKKIRKFSEGGGVGGDWTPEQIDALGLGNLDVTDADMDALFEVIGNGDFAVPPANDPGDWAPEQIAALGMDGMNDIELTTLLGAIDNGMVPAGLENIFGQQLPVEVVSAAPVTPVGLTDQQQAQPNVTVAPTAQVASLTPPSTGAGEKPPAVTPDKQFLSNGKVFAQRPDGSYYEVKPESAKSDMFSWKNILNIGLPGLAGLAAYKNAKAGQKAAQPFNENALLQQQLETQLMQRIMNGGGLPPFQGGGGGGTIGALPQSPTSGGTVVAGRNIAPARTSFSAPTVMRVR